MCFVFQTNSPGCGNKLNMLVLLFVLCWLVFFVVVAVSDAVSLILSPDALQVGSIAIDDGGFMGPNYSEVRIKWEGVFPDS